MKISIPIYSITITHMYPMIMLTYVYTVISTHTCTIVILKHIYYNIAITHIL